MVESFRKGEKVEWESSGGHSTAKVVRKMTSATHIRGHKVTTTSDDPQYIVESERAAGAPRTSPRH